MLLLSLYLLATLHAQPTPIPTDNCLRLIAAGNTCAECNQGFYLEYFVCLPCAPLCSCSSQHDYCQNCTSLPYKHTNYQQLAIYSPQQTRCLLCSTLIPGCLECSSALTCTTC